MLGLPAVLETPKPLVALPWGSESMTSTLMSFAASEAAKLIAVVVFPTPPFWLAIANTRLKRRWYHAVSRETKSLFHVKRKTREPAILFHVKQILVSRETESADSEVAIDRSGQRDAGLPYQAGDLRFVTAG